MAKPKMSKTQKSVLAGLAIGGLALWATSGSSSAKPRRQDFEPEPEPEPDDIDPTPTPTPTPTPRPSGPRTSGTGYPPLNIGARPAILQQEITKFLPAPGGSIEVVGSGQCRLMKTSHFVQHLGRNLTKRSGQGATDYVTDVIYYRVVPPPAPGYEFSFAEEKDNPTAKQYVDYWNMINRRVKQEVLAACGGKLTV